MRLVEDLTDCHGDSQGISHCQWGNERRAYEDLEDCQEGSGSIKDYQEDSRSVSNCQVGRNENLRLSEGLVDSEKSLVQQGVLMKMGSVDLIVCQVSSGSIPYC